MLIRYLFISIIFSFVITSFASSLTDADDDNCHPGVCIDCSKLASASTCKSIVSKFKLEYSKFDKINRTISVRVANDKKINCSDKDDAKSCLCNLLINKINSQSNAIGFKVNRTLTNGVHVIDTSSAGRSTTKRPLSGRQSKQTPTSASTSFGASKYRFKSFCTRDAKTSVSKITIQFISEKQDQITDKKTPKGVNNKISNSKPTQRRSASGLSASSSSTQRRNRLRSQKLRLPSTKDVNTDKIIVDMKLDPSFGDANAVVIKVGEPFTLLASIRSKDKDIEIVNDGNDKNLDIENKNQGSKDGQKSMDANADKKTDKIRIKRDQNPSMDMDMDPDAMFIDEDGDQNDDNNDQILASESESIFSSSAYQEDQSADANERLTLRMFLPPFLSFDKIIIPDIVTSDASVDKKIEDGDKNKNNLSVDTTSGLDIKINKLDKKEEIKFKMVLKMSDAFNSASTSSHRDANLIKIPYIMLCSPSSSSPSSSPSSASLLASPPISRGGKSSLSSRSSSSDDKIDKDANKNLASQSQTSFSACSHFKHVSVRVEPVACDGPLGMDSGVIKDCQISASTFWNQSTVPWNARPSSDNFWTPIFDLDIEHNLEIDLKRSTKVTSIQLFSVPDHSKISSLSVYAIKSTPKDVVSDVQRPDADKSWILIRRFDGVNYDKRGRSKGLIISDPSSDNNPDGVRSMNRIKIVINNVTKSDASTDKKNNQINLVAVKLELYGCYLQTLKNGDAKNADSCLTSNSSSLSSVGRQFVVNKDQNMAFVCDNFGSLRERRCFMSHESSIGYWINLGNLISSIIGFDSKSDRFIARDADDKNFLSTKDGSIWTPISDLEASEIISSPSFDGKSFGMSTISAPGIETLSTLSSSAASRRAGKRGKKEGEGTGSWTASREALISKDGKPAVVWI